MSRILLLQGNQAVVEGAIAAGVKFFGGYPITPSTEIAEQLADRLPKVGGKFMQMEDEIAGLGAVIGASMAGCKVMDATSGPGFSLKQEMLGMACAALRFLSLLVERTACRSVHRSAHQPLSGRCDADPLGHPRRSLADRVIPGQRS
jgi:hypothetical protein